MKELWWFPLVLVSSPIVSVAVDDNDYFDMVLEEAVADGLDSLWYHAVLNWACPTVNVTVSAKT